MHFFLINGRFKKKKAMGARWARRPKKLMDIAPFSKSQIFRAHDPGIPNNRKDKSIGP